MVERVYFFYAKIRNFKPAVFFPGVWTRVHFWASELFNGGQWLCIFFCSTERRANNGAQTIITRCLYSWIIGPRKSVKEREKLHASLLKTWIFIHVVQVKITIESGKMSRLKLCFFRSPPFHHISWQVVSVFFSVKRGIPRIIHPIYCSFLRITFKTSLL